jgi:hypothetical protein
MIGSAPLSWALSLVFLATAAFYGWRIARPAPGLPPTRAEHVSSVAHVVMSLGMIPMLWWWGMILPAPPQLAVFGAAAVWFLALAVVRAPEPCCSLLGRRRTHLYHLHHFTLMAAMVWMVVAMSVPSLLKSSSPAESSMGSMASMAGGTPAAHAMDHTMMNMSHAGDAGGGSPVAIAVTVALAVYFLVLVPWWLYEVVAVRRGRGRRLARRAAAVQAGVHAVKCAGMGVMLLAMA